jgi:hypothetical protein
MSSSSSASSASASSIPETCLPPDLESVGAGQSTNAPFETPPVDRVPFRSPLSREVDSPSQYPASNAGIGSAGGASGSLQSALAGRSSRVATRANPVIENSALQLQLPRTERAVSWSHEVLVTEATRRRIRAMSMDELPFAPDGSVEPAAFVAMEDGGHGIPITARTAALADPGNIVLSLPSVTGMPTPALRLHSNAVPILPAGPLPSSAGPVSRVPGTWPLAMPSARCVHTEPPRWSPLSLAFNFRLWQLRSALRHGQLDPLSMRVQNQRPKLHRASILSNTGAELAPSSPFLLQNRSAGGSPSVSTVMPATTGNCCTAVHTRHPPSSPTLSVGSSTSLFLPNHLSRPTLSKLSIHSADEHPVLRGLASPNCFGAACSAADCEFPAELELEDDAARDALVVQLKRAYRASLAEIQVLCKQFPSATVLF